MSEAPYDYAAKGRADYEAGRRDNRLYEDTNSSHAALYRRGWQDARVASPWGSDPAPGEPIPQAVAGQPLPQGSPVPPQSAEALHVDPPASKRQPKAPKQPRPDQLSLF
jgi:hypothetical protein